MRYLIVILALMGVICCNHTPKPTSELSDTTTVDSLQNQPFREFPIDTETKKAETIVQRFIQALKQGNVDEALQYVTETSKPILEEFREILEESTTSETPSYDEELAKVSCSVQNQTGTCDACCNINGEASTFKLIKQQQQWLIHIQKEDTSS